jgi:hypothetical protein
MLLIHHSDIENLFRWFSKSGITYQQRSSIIFIYLDHQIMVFHKYCDSATFTKILKGLLTSLNALILNTFSLHLNPYHLHYLHLHSLLFDTKDIFSNILTAIEETFISLDNSKQSKTYYYLRLSQTDLVENASVLVEELIEWFHAGGDGIPKGIMAKRTERIRELLKF